MSIPNQKIDQSPFVVGDTDDKSIQQRLEEDISAATNASSRPERGVEKESTKQDSEDERIKRKVAELVAEPLGDKIKRWKGENRNMVAVVPVDDNVKDRVWSGKVTSRQIAESILEIGPGTAKDDLGLEGKQDDFVATRLAMRDYLKQFFEALTQTPDAMPKVLKPDLLDGYQRGQWNAHVTVRNELSSSTRCDQVEARIFMLVDRVITMHEQGHFPTRIVDSFTTLKLGAKPECGLVCSQRLALILDAARRNKLISVDIVEGTIDLLICSPKRALQRKMTVIGGNKTKEDLCKKQKAIKQQEDLLEGTEVKVEENNQSRSRKRTLGDLTAADGTDISLAPPPSKRAKRKGNVTSDGVTGRRQGGPSDSEHQIHDILESARGMEAFFSGTEPTKRVSQNNPGPVASDPVTSGPVTLGPVTSGTVTSGTITSGPSIRGTAPVPEQATPEDTICYTAPRSSTVATSGDTIFHTAAHSGTGHQTFLIGQQDVGELFGSQGVFGMNQTNINPPTRESGSTFIQGNPRSTLVQGIPGQIPGSNIYQPGNDQGQDFPRYIDQLLRQGTLTTSSGLSVDSTRLPNLLQNDTQNFLAGFGALPNASSVAFPQRDLQAQTTNMGFDQHGLGFTEQTIGFVNPQDLLQNQGSNALYHQTQYSGAGGPLPTVTNHSTAQNASVPTIQSQNAATISQQHNTAEQGLNNNAIAGTQARYDNPMSYMHGNYNASNSLQQNDHNAASSIVSNFPSSHEALTVGSLDQTLSQQGGFNNGFATDDFGVDVNDLNNAAVDLAFQQFFDADGNFTLDNIEPGSYSAGLGEHMR